MNTNMTYLFSQPARAAIRQQALDTLDDEYRARWQQDTRLTTEADHLGIERPALWAYRSGYLGISERPCMTAPERDAYGKGKRVAQWEREVRA